MTKAVFLLLLVPAFVFAQGQIIFQNHGATAITNIHTGQRAATTTRVGFYINPNVNAPSQFSPGWVMIGSTSLIAPGIFLGGAQTVPGFPADTPVAVHVRAWLATGFFVSYDAALAGAPGAIFGHSVVMQMTPRTGTDPAPILTGSGLQPFTIGVPEPTTLALAGLGLASLAFAKTAGPRRRGR